MKHFVFLFLSLCTMFLYGQTDTTLYSTDTASTKVNSDIENEVPVFQIVELMPSFKGGEEALYKFLADNIKYPQVAKETGIMGNVIATFIVEQNGSISDIHILKDIGGGCGEEVIRVLRLMPKWNHGEQDGVPVRVQYNLPVRFTLDDGLPTDTTSSNNRRKKQQDIVLLNIYTDIWGKPSGIKPALYCPGIDAYMMRNISLGNSRLSLGIGLGISSHNLRSDARPEKEVIYDESKTIATETGRTIFSKIPETISNNKINYDNNKLSLSYIEIPFELRYSSGNNNGKAFKLAFGFKAGLMINNHTKYKGDDLSGKDNYVKIKEYRIGNINPYSYGITGRLGYNFINVFGYYSLATLFKKDKGPEMFPISLGICFTPLF